MVLYHVVKLTKIGKDGKLNIKSVAYGLFETILIPSDRSPGFQDLAPYAVFINDSVEVLGGHYGNIIAESERHPGNFVLSFRPVFDIVQRAGGGKYRTGVYMAEDLLVQEQERFRKGMLEELIVSGKA